MSIHSRFPPSELIKALRAACDELQREDVPPDHLREIGGEVEGIRAFSAYLRYPAEIATCARDLLSLVEHRFGIWLDSLERRRGSRTPSEYGNALEWYRLSHTIAGRCIALGQEPVGPVIERIRTQLERLESDFGVDTGQDVLRTSPSRSGADARDHEVDSDEDWLTRRGYPPGWYVPKVLFDAARNTLGTIDQVIEPGLFYDDILSGTVFACVPHRALFTSTRKLLSSYQVGSVTHVILLAEVDQDSPGWRFYARWPHCIVTYMAHDESPDDWLSAFCLSEDRGVRARFREHFEPLGFYCPGAASADARDEDGALES